MSIFLISFINFQRKSKTNYNLQIKNYNITKYKLPITTYKYELQIIS